MAKKKFAKKMMALMLVGCVMGSMPVEAASSTANKYINSTYGYLTGNVEGGYDGFEKLYYSYAETTKPVNKIRSKLSVCYYSTGKVIGDGENTGWRYNSNSAHTCNYEMHHFKNALTGKYDNFVNTKCTAYGTADAITSKAYAVYTSVTF